MTPWIFIVLGLIVGIGIGKLMLMWKVAQAKADGPADDGVVPMTNRRASIFAIGLIVLVFLSFNFFEMYMWFVPIIAYVAVWTPQVARKSASQRQAVYVGAAFGSAMVLAVLVMVLTQGD